MGLRAVGGENRLQTAWASRGRSLNPVRKVGRSQSRVELGSDRVRRICA